MAFGLNFFDLAPGLRVAGDSVAFAYKFTKKGGQGDGVKALEVGLVDDPTIKLLEAEVSGFQQVADVDVVYTALVNGGLTELVTGLAIGIDSLSSIDTSASSVRLALAGSQPVLVFRNANVPAVTKIGDGGYTWDLPASTFATLKLAAETYQSDLKTKVDEMIALRIAADDVLTAAIGAQASSDAAARAALQADIDQNESDADAAIAAEEARVDALIASGMWLFANQGEFPAAADNHGRVVHSHADGAMFYAHAGAWHQLSKEVDLQTAISSIANEASTREAADTALSGRLDVLEADPTTATALAAGDAATLSSANTYTDGEITTEAGTRAAADTALSDRLDTLEADPTTAAAVAAVQADVDQNEADADAALALKAPLADPDFTGQLDVDVNARVEFADNLTKIHNVLRGTSINIGNNIEMKPAAAGGRVEITGDLILDFSDMVDAANDADAATAGVQIGGVYRHNNDLKIRIV